MFKKITSVFLCVLIVFSIVITDYKKVYAFEWAVPTVTWEIAAPFLFGLLGVTYVGSSDTFWDNTEDEFLDYAQTEGYTGPDVRKWISDVCSGTLNQVSGIWSCFKSYVSSVSTPSVVSAFSTVLDVVQYCNPNITSVSSNSNFAFDKGVISYRESNSTYFVYLFNSTVEYTFDDTKLYFESTTNSSDYLYLSFTASKVGAVSSTLARFGSSSFSGWSASVPFQVFGVSAVPTSEYLTLINGGTTANLFQKLLSTLDNLDLISSGATSVSIPDVISLPWDKVGENTDVISDSIDNLIELVQEGVLGLSDFVTTIQGLLDVITIDTTNDIVIPETVNPDTDVPFTPEDVVQDNISNSAFILKGLEKVFPFCLPYDLYNFVTLLVAEPEAPEIHFPIYNPISGDNLTIDIDFEVWEPIVILFRYIFDFLFIIGLILIARALVGGGDKA